MSDILINLGRKSWQSRTHTMLSNVPGTSLGRIFFSDADDFEACNVLKHQFFRKGECNEITIKGKIKILHEHLSKERTTSKRSNENL